MTSPPRISVIIPVYNGETYLADAITSVLTQTLQPFEVIVVDDGSEDGSAAVARSFGEAVRYVHQPHAATGGAARARNLGADAAQGDHLAFLDADDLWTDRKLEIQAAALVGVAHETMVFGAARQFVSPELDEATKRLIACPTESQPAPVPSTMLITRDAFWRVGPFDGNWHIGEPLDWFLRATECGIASIMLPDVLLLRRLHTTNQGQTKRDARTDYVRILKASLDRRRGRVPTAPAPPSSPDPAAAPSPGDHAP